MQKNNNMIPCECVQLWPSVRVDPDNQAGRHAAGPFSRDRFTEQLHIYPLTLRHQGNSFSDYYKQWGAVNNANTETFHKAVEEYKTQINSI